MQILHLMLDGLLAGSPLAGGRSCLCACFVVHALGGTCLAQDAVPAVNTCPLPPRPLPPSLSRRGAGVGRDAAGGAGGGCAGHAAAAHGARGEGGWGLGWVGCLHDARRAKPSVARSCLSCCACAFSLAATPAGKVGCCLPALYQAAPRQYDVASLYLPPWPAAGSGAAGRLGTHGGAGRGRGQTVGLRHAGAAAGGHGVKKGVWVRFREEQAAC